MVNPSRAEGLFSPCGLYRYRLERDLASWKDHKNDATIRKVMGFTERAGGDRSIVVNEFAFIATDVNQLKTAADPIGPDNDKHIEQAFRDADFHIVAWGPVAKLPPKLRSRFIRIIRIAEKVGCKLHCLGVANDGHPRHPLMVGYTQPFIEWTPT